MGWPRPDITVLGMSWPKPTGKSSSTGHPLPIGSFVFVLPITSLRIINWRNKTRHVVQKTISLLPIEITKIKAANNRPQVPAATRTDHQHAMFA